MNEWKFYNYAIIPTTPPHINPNATAIEDGSVWGVSKNKTLLVRWTTDFDCGFETEWWYCIKDDGIDVASLKKKRRYEINSGLKNFDVRKISSMEYAEQIYKVYAETVQSYVNGGSVTAKEIFIAQCIEHENNNQIEYYGAFDKQDGELAAYALNHVFDDFVNFTTMKFLPNYLSKKVSAALVYTMLFDYINVQDKKYVNDGERSIRHTTNFQDYLIKYFGFRKAYCKLHVRYKPSVRMAIGLLYPMRKIIKNFAKVNTVINNVSGLLEMESIRRSFKNN